MKFSSELIEELISRVNILSLVERYTSVVRSGSNRMAICPFHKEKTPSMCVYESTNSFYCFGCHVGGNAISFFMKVENLDYHEAVKILAEQVGITIDNDNQKYVREKIIHSINEDSAQIYCDRLFSKNGNFFLNYLIDRGLSLEIIKRFKIGLSFKDKISLCNILKKKYGINDIVSSNLGILSKSGNLLDRFMNRITFPIFDLRGNVIAFGARSISNLPKYLNTSDTPTFKKSKNLFALNFSKNQKYAILTEGYMDAISLHQLGFSAIASLGTALSVNQVKLISKYFEKVYLCYDSDSAGNLACNKAIDILKNENLDLKIIKLSGVKDANDLLKRYGDDAKSKFQSLIDSAISPVEYKISNLELNCDLNNINDKVSFLKGVSKILSNIKDPIERDIYASKICLKYKVSKNAFDLQINKCINISSDCEFVANKSIEFFHGNSSNVEEFLISSIVLGGKFPKYLHELVSNDFHNDVCLNIFEIIEKMDSNGECISFNSVYNSILDDSLKNEFIRISNLRYVEDNYGDCLKKIFDILVTNRKLNELKSSNNLDSDNLFCFLDKIKERKK